MASRPALSSAPLVRNTARRKGLRGRVACLRWAPRHNPGGVVTHRMRATPDYLLCERLGRTLVELWAAPLR
jgi:hypothetical protein